MRVTAIAPAYQGDTDRRETFDVTLRFIVVPEKPMTTNEAARVIEDEVRRIMNGMLIESPYLIEGSDVRVLSVYVVPTLRA
jgi:hypothetical protein